MMSIEEAREILVGIDDLTDEDLKAILMTMYVMAEAYYDSTVGRSGGDGDGRFS